MFIAAATNYRITANRITDWEKSVTSATHRPTRYCRPSMSAVKNDIQYGPTVSSVNVDPPVWRVLCSYV